ncbi:MAG: hypothetical protein LUE11_00345 [Clostridia bacterium]|nr:hypothetical protein [Clostridia bacterium]
MKIDRRNMPKAMALVLSGLLIWGAAVPGFAVEKSGALAAENSTTSVQDSTSNTKKSTSSQKEDKAETVRVKADAEGNTKSITVEEVLKNDSTGSEIQDYSTLKDIRNTKGDEEFTQKEDGTILWENHGEDIQYKGTSDGALPFSVKVSYYLNGKKISPDDLAGKSGKVRIRFDYENHTSETVEINGEKVEVPVPFTMVSAMFLPSDVFSNITVSNGKTVSMDEQNVVIGYAFPGLADSLKLKEYEPTEDISIPDYVEVTADVTNFALDFTATVAATGAFEDMDLSDLDDVDDLSEDMEKLTDASSRLSEGTTELFSGMETFRSYMLQYTQGVSAVHTGADALTTGLAALNAKKDDLADGAAGLQNGLESLNQALAQVSIPDADDLDSSAASAAVAALAEDAETLAAALKVLDDNLSEIETFAVDAKAYANMVQDKANDAEKELESVDLSEVEAAANEKARNQAVAALDAALEDTELTAEEKAGIREHVAGSIDVSGTTSAAQGHISSAQEQLKSIPSLDVPDLSADVGGVVDIIDDMSKQMKILKGYSGVLSDMSGNLSQLDGMLQMLRSSTEQLAKGSAQLTDGITAFNQGIAQLYSGSASLSNGASQLSTAGKSLDSGFGALLSGTQALNEGIQTFDEEGIQNLDKLAGDDLETVITRLKALKEADSRYENFAGIQKDKTGSVRFIVETEEIKK